MNAVAYGILWEKGGVANVAKRATLPHQNWERLG